MYERWRRQYLVVLFASAFVSRKFYPTTTALRLT